MTDRPIYPNPYDRALKWVCVALALGVSLWFFA